MKKALLLFVCAGLTLFSLIGCASTPKEWTVTLAPKLDESLRKYMGPQPQRWDDDKITYVYFLDPLRFEEFKAELDAGGEYLQADDWNEKNRNWARGRTFVRWAVRPNGSVELNLCKEDNSNIGYRYIKLPQAQGQKLDESLRKYMSPQPETWGNDDKYTYIYYLDPLRFEELKAELDAGGEYLQADDWNEKNRNWDRGMTSARLAVRPDGGFELELYKEDNSNIGYGYIKFSQAQ